MKRFMIALALILATAATAQPAEPQPAIDCKAESAAIEHDIDLARSRGQMLRRQQLAETLALLQDRCRTTPPEQRRAARIDVLEHEIKELRAALDHAEEELRKLKAAR